MLDVAPKEAIDKFHSSLQDSLPGMRITFLNEREEAPKQAMVVMPRTSALTALLNTHTHILYSRMKAFEVHTKRARQVNEGQARPMCFQLVDDCCGLCSDEGCLDFICSSLPLLGVAPLLLASFLELNLFQQPRTSDLHCAV